MLSVEYLDQGPTGKLPGVSDNFNAAFPVFLKAEPKKNGVKIKPKNRHTAQAYLEQYINTTNALSKWAYAHKLGCCSYYNVMHRDGVGARKSGMFLA